MALAYEPLSNLPAGVAKLIGPDAPVASKMMVAKGLSPLRPGEMLVALYQLSVTSDSTLTSAAIATATSLPETLLTGALNEPLPPEVIDFFAHRFWQKHTCLEAVLLNRSTHNETFVQLARLVGEAHLEMIAKNEERLLNHPAIIAALYMNPKTRMSTAQRVVELAARQGVRVDGIPAFDEAVKALAAEPVTPEQARQEDEAFARTAEVVGPQSESEISVSELDRKALELAAAAAQQSDAEVDKILADVESADKKETEKKKQQLTDLSPAAQIRIATLGNSFARSVLIRSKNKQVAMACIKSPGVTDSEALHYAINRSLDEEIIRYIAKKKQWLRLNSIKFALCNNPKCPLQTTMQFLPHLRAPDLKALVRSKAIPSALATAAKMLLRSRSG